MKKIPGREVRPHLDGRLAGSPGHPVAAWRMVPHRGRKAGLHLTSRELRLPVAARVTPPGELYLCTPNLAPKRLHLGRLLITHCLVIRPTW